MLKRFFEEIFEEKLKKLPFEKIYLGDLARQVNAMESLYERSLECYKKYNLNFQSNFEVLKNLTERIDKIENYIRNEKFILNIVNKEDS